MSVMSIFIGAMGLGLFFAIGFLLWIAGDVDKTVNKPILVIAAACFLIAAAIAFK